MLSLTGRRAVILGGTAGIGLATASLLAGRGATVTVGGRDESRLAAAASLPGITALPADATDADSLRRFYQQAGPVEDLVITVTGRGGGGPAGSFAGQDLLGAFAGKPVAQLRALALALPVLDPHGSVTFVTAASAQAALPGTAGLAAVNGAVEAAVRPLARELAPRRVNAVSPGVIETGWWDAMPEEARRAAFAQFAGQTLAGRIGTAEDVAHAIAALIENDYITGVILPCDGGLRLT